MTSKVKFVGSILAILTVWGLQVQHPSTGGATMALTITSAAFKESGMIPKRCTCDGSDVSPDLSWSGVPEGTRTLALICDDPDAPMGTWVHWVLFNIPPDVTSLPEGVPAQKTLPNGARHGQNDFRKFGYGGPCPPGGTHRYYFKLYALDTAFNLEAGIAKSRLVDAMKGHILAEGQLMGKYRR
jgi:Raf kinase inhibitor-like YbhB/YbcL family protein